MTTIGQLKKAIEDFPDDAEVCIELQREDIEQISGMDYAQFGISVEHCEEEPICHVALNVGGLVGYGETTG